MIRILHCLASLESGGVESRVMGMFHYLCRHPSRHTHMLCAFRGGRLADAGLRPLSDASIRHRILNRSGRFSARFCRDLRRTIREFDPDIVHAYNATAALWTRLFVARNRKRVMHFGGMGGLEKTWRWIERALMHRTDAFVFNSHSIRAVWEQTFRIPADVHVIFSGAEDTATPQVLMPPSPPPFTLLTICRLASIKNVESQIRVLRILHDRGMTDTRLIVVGDGPARRNCEALAQALRVTDAVMFEGFHLRPRDYHKHAHVYLCTSYSEGLSMALNAAMQDGMICIAARVGGCSEVITHGSNGFLVPCDEPIPTRLRRGLPAGQALPPLVYDHTTGKVAPPRGVNVTALADALVDIRSRYGDLGGIRRAARKRIIEEFSMKSYCASLDALYDGLV